MNETAAPEPAGQNPREPEPNPAPRRGRTWKRVLSLIILGATAALVIVQVTRSIRHDVQVEIDLAAPVSRDLSKLELMVFFEDDDARPISVAIFNFDEDKRPPSPVQHTLHLPNGRYSLVVKLHRQGLAMPLRTSRKLSVVGDVRIRYRLP